MQDILRLFLTRISTVGLVIISSLIVGIFPLELRQGSLVTLFSVGIPTILLAYWARPGAIPPGRLVRRLLHFILPPALLTAILGLGLFIGVYALRVAPATIASAGQREDSVGLAAAQTALTTFIVFSGLLLVIFVEPPTEWWVGASKLGGDWRPTWLALGLLAAFFLISLIPPLRSLFSLSELRPQEYLIVALTSAVWLFLVRAVWRSQALSRYLGMELVSKEVAGAPKSGLSADQPLTFPSRATSGARPMRWANSSAVV